MKSAEQIVEKLLTRIGQLYAMPQFAVYTLGELDSVLNELHWQYAFAVGRLDDFAAIKWAESIDDFRRRLDWHESHCPYSLPEEAADVIARWQAFDKAFGLEVCPQPAEN